MGTILLILFYILDVLLFLWYFTCTEHTKIPLILVIFDFILTMIPVVNIILFIINIVVASFLVDDYLLKLKDNWFNRTFLAYRG